MSVRFLPGRGFEAGRNFLQQHLPGYLRNGRRGVHYPRDSYMMHGRGSRKAAAILQDHFEELYDCGTSQVLPRSLEKLWKRDYKCLINRDMWPRAAPFASVFTDLACFLTPDGEISSDYSFRTLSNFFLRNFDDMMEVSPQTALICFNALDWMNQPMADICAVVGREMSFIQEIDEFPSPFPFRKHTLELLDEVNGRYVPYHREVEPWNPFSNSSGIAVRNAHHRPRLALDDPRQNRALQLPWHGGFHNGQMDRHRGSSVWNRQNLLGFGGGGGSRDEHAGIGYTQPYHRRPYRLVY
ncbi:MAG: hypothetical protein LQ340_001152 [Diploschistes diacapsis]|nr:MAG: hypothetical protein LQ340_001152 [Diploschistes diacapsis]